MKLAYVLDRFPVLSETFIAREIEGLAREGTRPELFALRAGEGTGAVAPPVEILPGPLSRRTIAARIGWFLRSPFRTAEAITRLVEGASRQAGTVAAELYRAVINDETPAGMEAKITALVRLTHMNQRFGVALDVPYSLEQAPFDVRRFYLFPGYHARG